MLIILTRPPKIVFPGCATYYLKSFAKKILGKTRGPDGVLQSLKRGLDELGFPYKINAVPQSGDILHVLSNVEALRYGILQKKKGNISRLMAGPNLVVMPDECNKILASAEIDSILIVSPWIQDLYNQVLPELNHKLHIWPAGVKIPDLKHDASESSCLVFRKNAPQEICNAVTQTLKNKNIPYELLEYGSFKQSEYFDALEKLGQKGFMIYLQEFESQGIALQEAWARNIPTIVWNKGVYVSPKGHKVVGNVAAPFLTHQAGSLFENTENFEITMESFVSKISSDAPFSPREYCISHLSDRSSAQIYLDMLY